MSNASTITAYDLLEDSEGTLTDLQRNAKEINTIVRDTVRGLSLDKAYGSKIKQVKNLKHKAGAGWVDGDPLALNPEADVKDTLSAKFKGLRDLILLVCDLGQQDLLEPYLQALEKDGINLDITGVAQNISDEAANEIDAAIANIESYQKNIDVLNDRIRKEDAEKADEIAFAPKSEYPTLVKLYNKKKNNKDIDDTFQSKIESLLYVQKAWERVYNDKLDDED